MNACYSGPVLTNEVVMLTPRTAMYDVIPGLWLIVWGGEVRARGWRRTVEWWAVLLGVTAGAAEEYQRQGSRKGFFKPEGSSSLGG